MIKIISVFIGLLLIITGLIFNVKAINKQKQKDLTNKETALISNICASVGLIESSFNKGIAVGSFENEKMNICINSLTVRNMLFLCEDQCEKTALFFLELSDYAKTDMQDLQKNQEYASFLSLLNKNILTILNTNNTKKTVSEIENLFIIEKKDYENILSNVEKHYSTLSNRVQANRQEVSNYAKSILGMPFSVSQFKGNYIYPKALSYSTKNAYANIFISGKTLLIMSEEDSHQISAAESDLELTAYNELTKHAPYASDFSLIHSIYKDGLVYFTFCPTSNTNGGKTINYDESIKIVLSIKSGTLKAFDATNYLKNYPSVPEGEIPKKTKDSKDPQTTVILNNKYYIESKTTTDPIIYTLTDTKTNIPQHFTHEEYILFVS